MSDYAIQTLALSKRFGQRLAVDNLSLQVERGLVYGFLGPNGAGKTTTIGMLLGLVKPTSGTALLFGTDVSQHPARALARVGAMIEAPAFYPYLSGRNNLRVLALATGLPERRIDEVLHAVELSPRARDPFRAYSQGMKQRLAIAAALLPDPELIILDEPTSGLDPAGMVEIRELIRTLAAGGRTIFMSSHLLHEVEQLCARVTILKEGRLVVEGRVADLLGRGRGVQIRVSGDSARAVTLLRAVPWVGDVEQHGDTLLVNAPGERAAELNALLARQDVAVAEIRARETTLEEYFLQVTRKPPE